MILIVEKTSAGLKKFGLVFDSSDLVLEVGMMSLADVDEIFFHFLDVSVFYEFGYFTCRFVVKFRDVFENHSACDFRDFLFRCRATDLLEDPGIANRSPSYHEPGSPG